MILLCFAGSSIVQKYQACLSRIDVLNFSDYSLIFLISWFLVEFDIFSLLYFIIIFATMNITPNEGMYDLYGIYKKVY